MSASRSPMERWESVASANPILRFVDAVLRGFGQVMFQNSPITGLFFLAGLFVGGWEFGFYALFACVASTGTAYWLGVPQDAIGAGLYGYNGVLVGVALAFYLDDSWMLVPYVLLGAFAACIASAAIGNLLGTWQIPALTGPFVVTIWLFALGIYGFSQVEAGPNSQAPALPTLMESGRASLNFTNFYEGLFKGVSEVFFQNSIWVGIIFLIGIFLSSQIDTAMALLGSLIGLSAGWFLGVDQNSLALGLMGYNGVLTMIALAGLFYELDASSIIVAAIAVIVSVVVAIALTAFTAPYGAHIYTALFVLTTYGFIAAKPFLHRLRAVAPADASTPEGEINLYRRVHWWAKKKG
ncbi:MAG: urea transporter [Thermomicrobiales bacterium]